MRLSTLGTAICRSSSPAAPENHSPSPGVGGQPQIKIQMPLFVPRSASDHSSSPPLSCWKKSLPFLLLKAGLSQGGLPATPHPPTSCTETHDGQGREPFLDRAGHQPWPAPALGCCRGLRGVAIDQMGSNTRHDHSLALIRTWAIFPAPLPRGAS